MNLETEERKRKKVEAADGSSPSIPSSILRSNSPTSIFIQANLFICTDNVPLLSADENSKQPRVTSCRNSIYRVDSSSEYRTNLHRAISRVNWYHVLIYIILICPLLLTRLHVLRSPFWFLDVKEALSER